MQRRLDHRDNRIERQRNLHRALHGGGQSHHQFAQWDHRRRWADVHCDPGRRMRIHTVAHGGHRHLSWRHRQCHRDGDGQLVRLGGGQRQSRLAHADRIHFRDGQRHGGLFGGGHYLAFGPDRHHHDRRCHVFSPAERFHVLVRTIGFGGKFYRRRRQRESVREQFLPLDGNVAGRLDPGHLAPAAPPARGPSPSSSPAIRAPKRAPDRSPSATPPTPSGRPASPAR